jgi:hypothetical protein
MPQAQKQPMANTARTSTWRNVFILIKLKVSLRTVNPPFLICPEQVMGRHKFGGDVTHQTRALPPPGARPESTRTSISRIFAPPPPQFPPLRNYATGSWSAARTPPAFCPQSGAVRRPNACRALAATRRRGFPLTVRTAFDTVATGP